MFHSPTLTGFTAIVVVLGTHSSALAQQGVLKVQIVCDDMCCDGCAQTIAAQLYAAPGVTKVEPNLPTRVVTITAKASPKLTLEKLWLAAEQGKGGPSKLVGPNATYALIRPESLKPEQRWPAGKYFVVTRSLEDKEKAQSIADQLHTVRGVESIQIDMAQRALFIQSVSNSELSPWALLAAAERAQADPQAIGGPFGAFIIERPADAKRAASTQPGQSQLQGAVR
jgi:copper chaperone CopZ